MKAVLQDYQARMRRVLDYIDRHLDSDLDLETVSGVAAPFRLQETDRPLSNPLDAMVLGTVARWIINDVSAGNRVMYDVTRKPPGTIEWGVRGARPFQP